MVTHRDYSAEAVQAARRVLLELTRVLGEYTDHIMVVADECRNYPFPKTKNPTQAALMLILP